MAGTTRVESPSLQQLELSPKRLRIHGSVNRIHLALVISVLLISMLPFILDRFEGSGNRSMGVVLAVLVEIAFVVNRCVPRSYRVKNHPPFPVHDSSAKIPPRER